MMHPHAHHHATPSGEVGSVVEVASRYFSATDRHEAEVLQLFYEGRARQLVQQHLRGLGLGVADDPNPIESALLRYVIQSLAVSYRSPPTRYLRRAGERVGDRDLAQQILWEQYARAHVDAVLRHVDELRTLWRSCFVRVYASDIAERVRLVPFGPGHVYRDPEPGEEADPRADRRLAIKRGDGSYELWRRTGDPGQPGAYALTLHDARGSQLTQPELHDVLPVVAFFDGFASQPYLRPPDYRASYLYKIAATHNELISGVKWDVHPRATFETQPAAATAQRTTQQPPSELGPGQAAVLPEGMQLKLHNVQPQIAAISAATRELVEAWFRAESLPTDSFRQSQSVSALGLQTLAKPLDERRESLRPFVVESEQRLFEALRAQHNMRAEAWGQPWIDDSASLDVVLGSVDVPQDPTAHSEQLARDMALGLASPIDALMSRYGLTRAEALARHEQIQADRRAYGTGGQLPEVTRNLPDPDPENPNPAASTTQQAAAVTGGRIRLTR